VPSESEGVAIVTLQICRTETVSKETDQSNLTCCLFPKHQTNRKVGAERNNYLWLKDKSKPTEIAAGSLASKRWRRTAIKTSRDHNEIIAYIADLAVNGSVTLPSKSSII
jgi:hypothetical protein